MNIRPGSKLRLVLPVAILLLLVGLAALAFIIDKVPRTDSSEIALYLAIGATVLGPALLPAWYINRRFNPPGDIASWSRLFRQAGWVSMLGLVMAWMQANRVFNWLLVLPMAAMIFILEALILTISRASTRAEGRRD